MKNILVSDKEVAVSNGVQLIKVEGNKVDCTAGFLDSFSDTKVAVEDFELARKLGIYVYTAKKFKRTAKYDFYRNAPDWLQQKHEKHVIEAASVTRKVRRIRVGSLSELNIAELAAAGGVYLVKAPTGIGKSKIIASRAFISAVEGGRKAALISPLISICSGFHANAERETGESIAYYSNMAMGDIGSSGIVTTINSASKKCVASMTEGSTDLVIEEFQKTIETIAESKDLIGQRGMISDQLKRNVKSAHVVFALDADINDSAVEFCRAAGREPILIEIDADYSDVTVELKRWGQNFSEIKKAAAEGKKISIAVDSKKRGEKIAHALRSTPGLLFIHAENKGLEQQKAFLEAPNDNLDGVNVLIYTPVMGSSVSIELDYFDRCFACFTGVLTPMACVQMLRRIRTSRKFDVSIDAPNRVGWMEVGEDFERDESGINTIRERNRYLRESICTSLDITLRHLKFSVVSAEVNAKADSAGLKAFSQASREHKKQYVQSVLSADLLCVDDAKRLLRSDTLDAFQVAARDATLTLDMCGEVSEDSIEFYACGAGVKAMRLHKILAMSDQACINADAQEHRWESCDRNYYEATKKMLTLARSELGVTYSGAQARSVLAKLRKLKTWNKINVCHLPAKERLDDKTVLRKAGEILRALGYKTRTRDGVTRVFKIAEVSRFVDFYLRGKSTAIPTGYFQPTAGED